MSSQAFIFNPQTDRLSVAGVGLQMPRLSTTQRTAIAVGPGDAGLMVFDVDFGVFYGWNGTAWVPCSSGGGGGILLSGIGSPEGVVTAPEASLYWDVTVPTSPVQYYKTTATGNTGWI